MYHDIDRRTMAHSSTVVPFKKNVNEEKRENERTNEEDEKEEEKKQNEERRNSIIKTFINLFHSQ